jgi:hypothetical protein
LFHYKAATSARRPTAPPIPATKPGAAPDDETGAGALVAAVKFEAGTLVVTTVTLVVFVEVDVVDAGPKGEVLAAAVKLDVVVAASREAEY